MCEKEVKERGRLENNVAVECEHIIEMAFFRSLSYPLTHLCH
jgi:hypothetical protein